MRVLLHQHGFMPHFQKLIVSAGPKWVLLNAAIFGAYSGFC